MRAITIVLTLLVPALVACSGGEAKEASAPPEQEQATTAWKSDVAGALGTDEFDFAALEQQAAVDCTRTKADQWTVTLALSGARSATDLTRVGLEHACPGVVDAYDSAVQVVDSTPEPLTLVCAPGVVLSDADAQMAQMVCASSTAR